MMAVYILRGGDEPLYVGCTADLTRRLRQHWTQRPWTRRVTRIDVEHFDTREDALARERGLIAELRPEYNHRGKSALPLPMLPTCLSQTMCGACEPCRARRRIVRAEYAALAAPRSPLERAS